MSHQQKKKRRLDDNHQNNDAHLVTFDALSNDELARIFEYLSPENIMLARLNKKMRDAAIKTVVPVYSDIDNAFFVDSSKKYYVLAAMTTALPNLQQIGTGIQSSDPDDHPTYKYNDGEDPYHYRYPSNRVAHDNGILSNFTRLRELRLHRAPLNGRYPMLLFNFPLLQKLHIDTMLNLKWDLEMLAGLPSLEELVCENVQVTGNIKSLRVLKDTLSKIVICHCVLGNIWGNVMDLADFPKLKYLCLVDCGDGVTIDFDEMSSNAFSALEALKINHCQNIRGDFMNLSDFPHLKVLNLGNTAVTGDIRDIGNDDFPSLESLEIPPGVYGGCGFRFERIKDAPDVIAAVSALKKQRPNLQLKDWYYARLSCFSPDWYEALGRDGGRLENGLEMERTSL